VKLPNGEQAIVDIGKLLDYCLNVQHPGGRHKARVFASAGIHETDAAELQTALLTAARENEAQVGLASAYGQRYVVDFNMIRPTRTIRIRSSWIVRNEEKLPRLTSCYVL